jgi:high-affinity iron transporter
MNVIKNFAAKLAIPVYLITALVFGASAQAAEPADFQHTAQSIIHSLDYISVDYPGAFENGKVTKQGEYQEQLEIASHAVNLMNALPDNPQKAVLTQQTVSIKQAIQNKAAPDTIVQQCRTTITALVDAYNVIITPRAMPSLQKGQQLFQSNCVTCHGAQGFGNGVQAAALDPQPANFHDRSRQQNRNILSLYNTISLGVQGTAMPAFTDLDAMQRWSLAFYVSTFFANDNEVARGESLWTKHAIPDAFRDMQQLVQLTPAQAANQWGGNAVALMTYLRANPDALQDTKASPLDRSRQLLNASLAQYREGKHELAYKTSIAAYLEGFELVESNLKRVAPELKDQIEHRMLDYRNLLREGKDISQIEPAQQTLLAMLDDATAKMKTTDVSPSVNFFTSLLILLREGVEAILVLAAIVAVLIKSGRRDALRYIHVGWISALLLGVLTWLLASEFISISGASRELTEGFTALIAAGMLFYVGFWLHNQSHAAQWQTFIRSKLSTSLSGKALWGMTFIAFIAVYREIFETILFYESLWLNAKPAEQNYIVSGFVVAALLLVILAWGILRYSVRLPLRAFFTVNMVLMFLLSIVFAGKGVAALQEAGTFPLNPVNFPRIDVLGIYPNLESLGLQLVLIVLALSWWGYQHRKNNHRHAGNIEQGAKG